MSAAPKVSAAPKAGAAPEESEDLVSQAAVGWLAAATGDQQQT